MSIYICIIYTCLKEDKQEIYRNITSISWVVGFSMIFLKYKYTLLFSSNNGMYYFPSWMEKWMLIFELFFQSPAWPYSTHHLLTSLRSELLGIFQA